MTATKFMKQKGADKKQKDSKPDASSLIDTLKALKRSLEKKQQLPNEVFEKFKETSAVLSSLLPKTTDKSVFEIDDLLYSNEDKHPPSSSRSKDSNEFLISKCIDPFHYIFCCLELEHKLAPCRIMDSTYLQLIEHSSGILLTSKHRRFNALRYISHIIANKSVSNICRALKFLKVCLSRHKQLINAEIKQDINVFKTFVFLSNTKNIPKGKQPRTKRITSWLFKQSSNIFGKLKLESNDESFKDTLKLFRKLDGLSNWLLQIVSTGCRNNVYDKDYVKCVQNIGIKHLQINCFYKYFSTTENEEEETQRAKDFLEGLNGATQDPGEIIGVCSGICKEIDLGDIEFLDCCNYPEQLMRLVDKYHSNDVKSNKLSTDVDALNDLQESHDLENECDFTFQKFFVYDEFLKYLYLQSKIYNILKRLTKNDKNSEGWDGRIFRNSSCFVNKFLNSRLRTPSKCGELPWWLHTTLSKCPFLFLSERHENMMEDLIKMLKGEEIDDSFQRICNSRAPILVQFIILKFKQQLHIGIFLKIEMQIFVQCNHPFVYVLSGKETVGNLKKRFGEDATFSCSGRPLKDDMLLSQHVPEHGTVVVHMGLLGGKVHGSLARAGKVKGQTPQVEKAEKVKKLTGRAKKRSQFNRRFVNVVHGFGVKKGPNSQSQDK